MKPNMQNEEIEPSMLDIHLAEASDQAKIIQLWHRGWHEAHADLVPPEVLPFRTKDHFAIWLREAQDVFYIAVKDTELLGFVSVKGAEIVKLYLGTHARGTGVAQALLAFAETLLRENGVARAELLCTAGNTRAERFYTREGWNLSASFEADLWMPRGAEATFKVPTHRFQEDLAPTG